MECHNPAIRRVLPVLPKPLRCGERGYSDMVKGFCSPPAAIGSSSHSLEQVRQPLDQFQNVGDHRCGFEAFGSEGTVKEAPSWNSCVDVRPPSWNSCEVVRPPSWNSREMIRPPSWNSREIMRPPSWNPCETTRPSSWSPREGGRTTLWNSCTACCKYCSAPTYSELGNFPTMDKDRFGLSTAEACPGLVKGLESPVDDGAIGRSPVNSMLSQSVNTVSTSGGDRVFKCDHPECPKSFTRKEELTRHKRTHSNVRAFECQICSRKFIRKDHMTKHLATHEDVSKRRRYICKEPGCSRRYTRSDALSRHRTAAHPDNLHLGSFHTHVTPITQ